MIPAPDGIRCLVLVEGLDGLSYPMSYRVVAFDENGEPMVISRHRLRCASQVGTGKWELEDRGSVTVIPGGGWMARHLVDGVLWSEPVVAWRIEGVESMALVADSDGMLWDLAEMKGDWSVFHPDESRSYKGGPFVPHFPSNV